MNKPLVLTPPLQKQLVALPKLERVDALLALLELTEGFGQPHRHSGLGIRKLHKKTFECRAGLKLRLVFRDEKEALVVRFVGNHDEVRKFVGTLR